MYYKNDTGPYNVRFLSLTACYLNTYLAVTIKKESISLSVVLTFFSGKGRVQLRMFELTSQKC
jgi:hypothetical protein